MPNWASTSYVVTGDEKDTKDLFKKMVSLEKRTASLVNTGFGKTFLGNLVELLGGQIDGPNSICCRGYWECCKLHKDGTLRFFTETAWNEMADFRHFLEKQYPSLKIYYVTEEGGSGIYETNDAQGIYFPYLHVIEVTGRDFTEDKYLQCRNCNEVRNEVERLIGRMLDDDESVDDALDKWAEKNNVEYACYRKYEIVND